MLKVTSSLDLVNPETTPKVEQSEDAPQPDVLKEIAALMKDDPIVFKKPKLLRGWKVFAFDCFNLLQELLFWKGCRKMA